MGKWTGVSLANKRKIKAYLKKGKPLHYNELFGVTECREEGASTDNEKLVTCKKCLYLLWEPPMHKKMFMKLYQLLGQNGWTRKKNKYSDSQLYLKSPRGKRYNFSPATAVYYSITSRRIEDANGVIYHAFKRLGKKYAMNWNMVELLYSLTYYPADSHPHEWDSDLKEFLHKKVPVG